MIKRSDSGERRRLCPQRSRSLCTAFTVAVTAVVTALVAAGCSGGTISQSTAKAGTLTIGDPYVPNSLDPAKINSAMAWYADLAYDPLIYQAPDGKLEPRLATSWNYVGASNTEFELHLRPNVSFSDGSPLTADVVKQNIAYYRSAGGAAAPYLSAVKSVDTPNSSTVHITLSQPDPMLPEIFTQQYQAGNIISENALKNPSKLATQTYGAGPYVLSVTATVAGDHYTYTSNPHYWNKSLIHYGSVVIRVLPNPNTALAALKTGQVDVIQGIQSTADAAKSAGLNVITVPLSFEGLALADRAGKVVPALGDPRVRQALNYAVNRQELVKVFNGHGTPTDQIALPGQDGYSNANLYAYDPKRARQLLAQAGYPNGFALRVLDLPTLSNLTQVIAEQLAAIGVRLQVTDDSEPNQYLRDMASGKFAGFAIGFGSSPIYLEGPRLFLPSAAQFNPFRSSDPQINSLYSKAAAASPASRSRLDQQIVTRIRQLGWFVPVAFVPVLFYSQSTVAGVAASSSMPTPDPVDWRPASTR